MPALAAITLLDAAEASVIMNPTQRDGLSILWEATAQGVRDHRRTLSFDFRPAKNGAQVDRYRIRFSEPVLRTIDGVVVKTDTARADVTLIVPTSMSSAERGSFIELFDSIFRDTTIIQTAVTNAEAMY